MLITEEILAAFAEGRLADSERREVRSYLVGHPEAQDVVLALMDDSDELETDVIEQKTIPFRPQQNYSDISFSAAAFAPRMGNEPSKPSEHKDMFEQRRQRMSVLWGELQNDK